jgi:hypothetical protein
LRAERSNLYPSDFKTDYFIVLLLAMTITVFLRNRQEFIAQTEKKAVYKEAGDR